MMCTRPDANCPSRDEASDCEVVLEGCLSEVIGLAGLSQAVKGGDTNSAFVLSTLEQ